MFLSGCSSSNLTTSLCPLKQLTIKCYQTVNYGFCQMHKQCHIILRKYSYQMRPFLIQFQILCDGYGQYGHVCLCIQLARNFMLMPHVIVMPSWYAHHRRVFSLLLLYLCWSRDQQVLNGEWGVYLPSSQRCLLPAATVMLPMRGMIPKPTQRWRCHFNFILSAKMTLQRGSRKRKSKSTSEENDLGCAKILTEFQILQSLIPQIAGRMDITEVSEDIFCFTKQNWIGNFIFSLKLSMHVWTTLNPCKTS